MQAILSHTHRSIDIQWSKSSTCSAIEVAIYSDDIHPHTHHVGAQLPQSSDRLAALLPRNLFQTSQLCLLPRHTCTHSSRRGAPRPPWRHPGLKKHPPVDSH